MKRQPFKARLGFAGRGVRAAWQQEASFRFQVFSALGAFGLLFILRPPPVWWALVALTTGAVCAAEMFNTALEAMADCLHPEKHPLIALAKDCAAGAVLLLSLVSLIVLGSLLWWRFG